MGLPADQVGEGTGDRLVGDQIAGEDHGGSRDQQDQDEAEKDGPAFGEVMLFGNFAGERDDAAKKPRYDGIKQRLKKLDHQ